MIMEMDATEKIPLEELIQSHTAQNYVELGTIVTTQTPEAFNLLGIGTCIGVYLYDLKHKQYSMAHCMLPKYSDNDKSEIGSPGKYINLALPLMIEWFTSQRSQKHEIKTKLVGGAQILNDTLNIGIQNIEMIHKTLAKEGIKIEAEDLGGRLGRSILSFNSDGTLLIRKGLNKYTI